MKKDLQRTTGWKNLPFRHSSLAATAWKMPIYKTHAPKKILFRRRHLKKTLFPENSRYTNGTVFIKRLFLRKTPFRTGCWSSKKSAFFTGRKHNFPESLPPDIPGFFHAVQPKSTLQRKKKLMQIPDSRHLHCCAGTGSPDFFQLRQKSFRQPQGAIKSYYKSKKLLLIINIMRFQQK